MRAPRSRGTRIAAASLGGMLLLALLAPLLLPDPNAITDPIGGALLAPSAAHLLGTDALSRDVLARLARGGALSILIGLLAAACSAGVGGLVGLTAGSAGRAVDALLMRGVDACSTVPRAFVLLFAAAAWPEMPIPALILLLGITGWYAVARIVRAEAARLMGTEALVAARALGAGRWRIMFRHLLPNVTGQLAVATALGVGEVMLLEAGLSFLGAGIRPPTASWGVMIHDGRDVLLRAPWVTVAPGIALTIVVLAVNRLGDALRDAADPRTR